MNSFTLLHAAEDREGWVAVYAACLIGLVVLPIQIVAVLFDCIRASDTSGQAKGDGK